MKHLFFFNAIVISILFINCNQGKQQSKINLGGFTPGKYCYIAKFEKDSASLNFDIDVYGKISGKLYFSYGEIKPNAKEREINNGDFIGEFRGDTLFADYNFTSGTDKNIYSNPIALLHQGDSLTIGKGRVMSYLGRNYFDEKTPISFERSRFRFKPVNCK